MVMRGWAAGRRWVLRLGLAAVVIPSAGCPMAHEAADPWVCFRDEDCFVLEGEFCYPTQRKPGEPGQCRRQLSDLSSVRPDFGPPDTLKWPDTALPDLSGDAVTDSSGDSTDAGDSGVDGSDAFPADQ